MKKILALSLLALAACKKESTTTIPKINYGGTWNIVQTVNKVYTLDQGDTTFTLNQTNTYPSGSSFIDFNIDNSGNGSAVISTEGQTDSLKYSTISHGYFRLDSTLCEVTQLSDTTFSFNTLIFQNSPDVPGKIQVTQDFFSLTK